MPSGNSCFAGSRCQSKEALCAVIGPAGASISTDCLEMLDVLITDAITNSSMWKRIGRETDKKYR